jgi:uncharacterized SAM-binding protein YcdF (DUF218 family)
VSGEFIVVLGAAVREGGRPSPVLQRRVAHAIQLMRDRPEAQALFTGGRGIHPPAEAEVMARLALDAGIAPERLSLESRATNTGESARFCAALLAGREVGRLVLVTDDYHQRRARLAFRRVGLAPQSSSPPPAPGSFRLARVRVWIREWVGLAWYGLTFRG